VSELASGRLVLQAGVEAALWWCVFTQASASVGKARVERLCPDASSEAPPAPGAHTENLCLRAGLRTDPALHRSPFLCTYFNGDRLERACRRRHLQDAGCHNQANVCMCGSKRDAPLAFSEIALQYIDGDRKTDARFLGYEGDTEAEAAYATCPVVRTSRRIRPDTVHGIIGDSLLPKDTNSLVPRFAVALVVGARHLPAVACSASP